MDGVYGGEQERHKEEREECEGAQQPQHRRSSAMCDHTAARMKAKISGRTNSVIIASVPEPRFRETRSAPRSTRTTTKPVKQYDELERYKAAYQRILEEAQEANICKEEQEDHDRCYRYHRPVKECLSEVNSLGAHEK
jgi:hypothetical protein